MKSEHFVSFQTSPRNMTDSKSNDKNNSLGLGRGG